MALSTPPAPRRWLTNLGYALFVAVWLFVMTVPCLAFALAARGELSWDRGEHDWDRVWLIQERAQQGLGFQSERVIEDRSASGGPVCVRNTVRYWLWKGAAAGSDADSCQCLAAGGASEAAACP
jgi:hypothetical protein